MPTTQLNPQKIDWDGHADAVPVDSITKADKEKIVYYLQGYSKGISEGQGLEIAPPPAIMISDSDGTVIADSFEDYLGATDYYSSGPFVKLSLGDPLEFKYEIEEGVKEELEKFKDRSCFDLGRFLHMAVLEPDKWGEVVVEPKASRASHDGCDLLITFWRGVLNERGIEHATYEHAGKVDDKKTYIEHLKKISGVTCLEEKQYIIISTLYDRWKTYGGGIWYDLIAQSYREVSMYCKDYRGLPMRIRPDALLFENQIGVDAIVSIKSSSKDSLRAFRNQCATLGYNLKEACYQDIASHITGIEFRNTIMVVFQTVAPFHVGVFLYGQQDLSVARDMFNDAFNEGKKLLDAGIYPGWDKRADNDYGLIDLSMPSWSNNQADEE